MDIMEMNRLTDREYAARRERAGRCLARRLVLTVIILINVMLLAVILENHQKELKALARRTLNGSNRAVLTEEGIPESLVNKMERYPETADFVKGYTDYIAQYPDRNVEGIGMDVSAEVTKGEIPLWLQWDSRWGYEDYGNDYMAVTGCGPTCLSMVYCGITGDASMNPYEVSRLANQGGYYVAGNGSAWAMMDELAADMGLSVHNVIFDESHIRAELEKGNPIICTVGPGDFTYGGHYIVLTGLAEDGNVIVNDPNSRINSEKTWELTRIMGQVKNLWGYEM